MYTSTTSTTFEFPPSSAMKLVATPRGDAYASYPPHNITREETKDTQALVFEFACAGFKKDELSVKVKGSVLEVTGTKKSTKEEKPDDVTVTKLHSGLAQRSIGVAYRLTDGFKVVSAKHEDGVLTIRAEWQDDPDDIVKIE